jgi:hypothetical protein
MAEEELRERYKRMATLIEELSKKYSEVGVSEEFIRRLEEVEEKVDFKLKEMAEKISALKAVPVTKKLKEEIAELSKKLVEEEVRKAGLPEMRKVAVWEGVIEKLSEKVESLDGRIAGVEREVRRPIEERVPDLEDMRDFLAASDKLISAKTKEEVEKRLGELIGGIGELAKDVRRLAKVSEGFEQEVEKVREQISGFRQNLRELVRRAVKEEFVERVGTNVKKELPKFAEECAEALEEKMRALIRRDAVEILAVLRRLSPRVQTIKDEVESLKVFRGELEARFVQMREGVEKSLGKQLMSSLSRLVEKNVRERFERLSAEMRDERLRQRRAVRELADGLAGQIKKELREEMSEKLKKVGVRIDRLARQIAQFEQMHKKTLLGLLKEVQG